MRRYEGNNLTLNPQLDSVSGFVNNDVDFLEVLSVLGSSESQKFATPVNLVIVIGNSASMYTNAEMFGDARIYKTVDAVNRAIDRIMGKSSWNQGAVVAFGDNGDNDNGSASTIIPMGHYAAISGDWL